MIAASHETHPQADDIIEKIKSTEHLLFNMADQLVDSKSDWNIVIGDDVGGRLPAHFVHEILKAQGRDFQTFFVTGSASYRHEHGEEAYRDYFADLRKKVGEPLRPLIVTESMATGNTVQFLKDVLQPFCDQEVEIAAVAASNKFAAAKANYVGGIGKAERLAAYNAYETPSEINDAFKGKLIRTIAKYLPPAVKSKVKSTNQVYREYSAPNDTVGIEPSLESSKPIARFTSDRSAKLATRAFREMHILSSKYEVERQDSIVAA